MGMLNTIILCTGPTKRYFEGKHSEPNWTLTHPWARVSIKYSAYVLGFLSSLGMSYWPLVNGQSIPEQLVAVPSTVSATALYEQNFKEMMSNGLDFYDSHVSQTSTVKHKAFLKLLESLPSIVKRLPDNQITAMIPATDGLEHPILIRYKTRNSPLIVQPGVSQLFSPTV
jgi:hypothetical protein